jgi:hypothetical protein
MATRSPTPATSAATPEPNSTTALVVDLTTTAAPDFQQAVLRGIFSFSGSGCRSAAVSFLAVTFVAFLAILVLRGCVTLYQRRKGGKHPQDVIRTYDTAAWRALLVNHMYVGVIVPCHHYCGPIHAVLFLVHVLSLYLFASAMQNIYPAAGSATHGAAAALVSLVIQPVFNVLFTMYRTKDRRAHIGASVQGYAPQDLTQFGVARPTFIGVSDGTVKALDELAFDAAFDDTYGDTFKSSFKYRNGVDNIDDVDDISLDVEAHRDEPEVDAPRAAKLVHSQNFHPVPPESLRSHAGGSPPLPSLPPCRSKTATTFRPVRRATPPL